MEKRTHTAEQLIAALRKEVLSLAGDMENIPRGNINVLLKAYKRFADVKKEIEEVLKHASEVCQAYSYTVLPTAMRVMDMDAVKTGGYNFILGARLQASIPVEKRDAGFAWLREHGLDALIKEGVNAQTLSSAIRSHMEMTGETPPEDAMTVHLQDYIQVRKA